MQSEKLIQSLLEQTIQIINHAEELKSYDLNTLTWKENEISWSILECLEHLNLYGDFYLPQIQSKLENSTTKADIEFRSGIFRKLLFEKYVAKRKTE
jgi:hypothetical protein